MRFIEPRTASSALCKPGKRDEIDRPHRPDRTKLGKRSSISLTLCCTHDFAAERESYRVSQREEWHAVTFPLYHTHKALDRISMSPICGSPDKHHAAYVNNLTRR